MNHIDNNISNQTINHYSRGYRWLHWSMAFLILLMFFALIGFANTTTVEEHTTMLIGHSSIGTIITILLLLRLRKRFVKKDPRPIHNLSNWQSMAAKFVHRGLYFCMIMVPLTGYLTATFHQLPVKVFGNFDISAIAQHHQSLFEILKLAHQSSIYLLMGLLVLHIGAALYHRFIIKDHVFASMKANTNKTTLGSS